MDISRAKAEMETGTRAEKLAPVNAVERIVKYQQEQ